MASRIKSCHKEKALQLFSEHFHCSQAVLAAFSFGSYFSWQLFLRRSWNNGYLSNRVKDGIKGGGFSLPSYTGEVIRNYVNHFFTYPLTRNRFGVTAFLLVIFIVAVYAVNIVNSRRSGEKTTSGFINK